MQKEITDDSGTVWTCVQAYTGLGDSEEKNEAARVSDRSKNVYVVCTPNGGAQSVRLQLPAQWNVEMNDDELEELIQNTRNSDAND